jgi:hypothetical protein
MHEVCPFVSVKVSEHDESTGAQTLEGSMIV